MANEAVNILFKGMVCDFKCVLLFVLTLFLRGRIDVLLEELLILKDAETVCSSVEFGTVCLEELDF